jgi:hypothetical protein
MEIIAYFKLYTTCGGHGQRPLQSDSLSDCSGWGLERHKLL